MNKRIFLLAAVLLCSLCVCAQRTDNPTVTSSNDPSLHIDYVEIKGIQTIIHITITNANPGRVGLLPLTAIVGTDKYGAKYQELVSAFKDDNGNTLKLGQSYNVPSGKSGFVLECAKMPAGCTSISIDESDLENKGWQIKGILINNPSAASSVSSSWLRTASPTDVAKEFVKAVMTGDMEKATRYMHGFQSLTAAQQKETVQKIRKDGFFGGATSAEIAAATQQSASAGYDAIVKVTVSKLSFFSVSNTDYTVKMKKRTQGWSVEAVDVKTRE